MLSVGEVFMARLALKNILAKLSDERLRKSIIEAVEKTIAGKPVADNRDEGETDERVGQQRAY